MGVSARAANALSRLSRQVSAYRLPQLCNLGGMSMNIQRKNSALHFRMQSEREQTLVMIFFLPKPPKKKNGPTRCGEVGRSPHLDFPHLSVSVHHKNLYKKLVNWPILGQACQIFYRKYICTHFAPPRTNLNEGLETVIPRKYLYFSNRAKISLQRKFWHEGCGLPVQ